MKYYTDKEILDLIKSKEVTELVKERFEQKDKQLKFSLQRVNVAADYIGHNVINELLQEEY